MRATKQLFWVRGGMTDTCWVTELVAAIPSSISCYGLPPLHSFIIAGDARCMIVAVKEVRILGEREPRLTTKCKTAAG